MRLTTQRRWLVPALLAMLVVGELSTGAAAAVHQRADLAQARRVAAEKRAAAAYVAALRPLANRVFDAVQPVQDASDAFKNPTFGLAEVRDDVLAKTGVVAELKGVRTKLAALPVPATYRQQAKPLDDALGQFVKAATELQHATTVHGDRTGYVAEFGKGFDDLYSAEEAWSDVVPKLDPAGVFPLPHADGGWTNGYKSVSRGRFVMVSDRACVAAFAHEARMPSYQGTDIVLHGFPLAAKEFRTLVTSLRAARLPASRTSTRRALDVGLPATLALAKRLDGLSRALARNDVEGLRHGLQDLSAGYSPLRDLGRAYRAEGATLCGDFFDVDDKGKAKSGNPTVGA